MANSSATNATAVDSGCPAVTLGDDLQLQARTWGLPFTADVFNVGSDPSDAERAGYIKAQTFHLERKMSFYNNKDEVIAHATKPFFTWGVDRTKVFDCNGEEMVAFAQLQSRNKHNTVSRYEVDDASDDEIADTRFYYQWMGSGDLKINEVGGGDTGKNLVKATSAGWLQGGFPPLWTVKLKAVEGSKLAGDVPGVLLWLSEEEVGMWGLGYGINALIIGLCICSVFSFYLYSCLKKHRSDRSEYSDIPEGGDDDEDP